MRKLIMTEWEAAWLGVTIENTNPAFGGICVFYSVILFYAVGILLILLRRRITALIKAIPRASSASRTSES